MSDQLIPTQVFAVVPPSVMVLHLTTLDQLEKYCDYLNKTHKEHYGRDEDFYSVEENKIVYTEWHSGYGNSTWSTKATKVALDHYVVWSDTDPNKHHYVYLAHPSYKIADNIPKELLVNRLVDITTVTTPLNKGEIV